MNDDHDHIEELLAGYALRSLSGNDAAEAEQLLGDHVPGCSSCHAVVSDFQAIAGDLALAADPVAPPDNLLPRLRPRLLEEVERFRRRTFALYAAAAALIVVVGLSAWSLMLNSPVPTEAQQRSAADNMINTILEEDGSKMVALQTGASPAPTAPVASAEAPSLLMNFQPGTPRVWVFGTGIPQPSPGFVYAIWLGRSGLFQPATRFAPNSAGFVQVFIPTDLSSFDQVMVTEEPVSAPADYPVGPMLWSAQIWGASG